MNFMCYNGYGDIMTITIKVGEETKKEMIEFFEEYKRPKTPDYAVFQADDADTVVTLYESGKAVFQGHDADLSSQIWIEREKHLNPTKKVEVTNSEDKIKDDKKDIIIDPKIYNSSSIGSDEVGTGDYFGPIVVTAAYVKKENIKYIESLGIKDSKKMTDEKILKVVPDLIKRICYETIVLSNEEYNLKYNDGFNMNKLKAILHNKVLLKMKEKVTDYDYIVVDEFANKYVYFSYLKESDNVVRNITFLTKGESRSLSVACASVISRFIFIKEIAKISKELNILIPKGASPSVDKVAANIVKTHGIKILNKYAKVNFKNTEKIKEML